MERGISVALIVVGVILTTWGITASESISSDVSRLFTGSIPDKVMWLILGGIAMAIVGIFGALRGTRSA